MSKENSRLVINCGSSHISATVFSFNGNQLKIEKSHSVSLEYDYQNEDEWLDAIDVGIKELVSIGKYSGKASFVIPGNQVLAKTLLLPTVPKNKQAQVLTYEAQYNLPYDLDEVVWDGEPISNDGIETEVLLGACKSDMANEFCEIMRQSGFRIESINASTLLSFSALKASKPDLPDNVLLINIGARSSTLYFKNEEGFFVRNINYGGNTLTQFISDSLGKTFGESDQIKQRYFDEENTLDTDSSAYKLMQSCISNFSSRFAQEIKRSIVMYRRQKGAENIERIFITGNGAKSEIIRNRISENLEQEIFLFNALNGIEVAGSVNTDAENMNFQISDVVGVALKEFDLSKDVYALNLVPLNVKQELKFIKQKPILIFAAFLLGFCPWLFYSGINKSLELKSLSLNQLREFAEPYLAAEKAIRQNEYKARILSDSISQFEQLVVSKTNWIQFFADIQESIYKAKDVWIDDLTVVRQNKSDYSLEDNYEYNDYEDAEIITDSSDYEVTVKGKMLVRQSASEIDQDILADRIKQIKTSFEDSSFVVSSKPPKISWKYLSDGLRVLPFEISLVIDTEKSL